MERLSGQLGRRQQRALAALMCASVRACVGACKLWGGGPTPDIARWLTLVYWPCCITLCAWATRTATCALSELRRLTTSVSQWSPMLTNHAAASSCLRAGPAWSGLTGVLALALLVVVSNKT
jgi:hypothetical protein